VITRQAEAAGVLSQLSTMNDKSSFVKVPSVITKQLVAHPNMDIKYGTYGRHTVYQQSKLQIGMYCVYWGGGD
jgi:hypothetical protein